MNQVREGTPLLTGLRVFAVGAIASVMIILVSLAILAPVTVGQRHAKEVVSEDLSLQRQVTDLRGTLVAWQLFLEPHLDASQIAGNEVYPPVEIAKGAQLTQTQLQQAKALETALSGHGRAQSARDLDRAMSSLTATITSLGPIASGAPVTAPALARIVAAERVAFARVWDITSTIATEVQQNITAPDLRYVTEKFSTTRSSMVAVGGAAFSLALGAGLFFARRAARRDREQRTIEQRKLYSSELQQALELSSTEGAVYQVVGRALGDAVPELNVEMLLADSSHAHFRRVLGSRQDAEHAEGCGVISPLDCPATIRAHTMVFPSSEALSACPYLRDRPSGSCSAACIPVSISGRAVGVMHATGADNVRPDTASVEKIEFSARRATERVALLRSFEKSETQARTDPLTGLLNRRSLQNQVRTLQNDGMQYALAYGDLDHFKDLNDTFGHEAGDQALRLFSRVMRDSVRPVDLVSRYGGEEFVIVLPDCSVETATAVLARVRERLALAVMSGRVPVFTVSFGLASSADAATFEDVVNVADQALLAAKAAGRDRIVLADTFGPRADATQADTPRTDATRPEPITPG